MNQHPWIWLCLAVIHVVTAVDYSTVPEVTRFQEYIKINTTTGNDLQPAVTFWKKLAAAQGVTITELQLQDGCPILILKWPGSNPALQSVMLNGHMDVVPADIKDGWTHPPFAAEIDSDGNIWGRGTQDMKSVSLLYYEAMSRLKAQKKVLPRTVYITLMPDEEVGGKCGMQPFVKSKEFQALNVAVGFDEGAPLPVAYIPVFIQDKAVWQITVDCEGSPAHGSFLVPINSTAVGKCQNVINTLLAFREQEYKIASTTPIIDSSGYTSVNLNKLNAGTANNVIPGHMSLVFDIRLDTKLDEVQFAKQLSDWITAAGPNVSFTYIQKDVQSPAVNTDKNPYWTAIQKVGKNMGFTVKPMVPPGSTDSRFVRDTRIPAFGFSPMPNTPTLVHAINEHLSLDTYLKGIPIYMNLITEIASLSQDVTGTDPSVYVHSTNGNGNS